MSIIRTSKDKYDKFWHIKTLHHKKMYTWHTIPLYSKIMIIIYKSLHSLYSSYNIEDGTMAYQIERFSSIESKIQALEIQT